MPDPFNGPVKGGKKERNCTDIDRTKDNWFNMIFRSKFQKPRFKYLHHSIN